MDKIMSSARGPEVSTNPPPQPTIEDLRKEFGTKDDDELILRALVHGEGSKKCVIVAQLQSLIHI